MLTLVAAVLATGCRLVQSTLSVPERTVQAIFPGGRSSQPDPAQLQQSLMNFADRYSAQLNDAVDELAAAAGSQLSPRIAIEFKIASNRAVFSIVASVDPYASLFDMVSFVTLTRMILEDHWVTREDGEMFEPWLEKTRRQEADLWRLVDQVLRPEQQAELRSIIDEHYRANPNIHAALLTRPQELAASVPRTVGAQEGSRSIFSLDPLGSLDPAVREVTETRLFAKRATFLLVRMPDLLRWQSQLFLLDAASQADVAQLIQNSTSVSESLERTSRVAEQLPDLVATEREALVRSLQEQQAEIAHLIEAASQLSDSLNATVTNTTTLVRLFGVGDTNRAATPRNSNARPFDINEYTLAAGEIATLARELATLVDTLEPALESPALQKATRRAESATRRALNHAFLVGGGLLLLAFLLALVLKAIFRRWNRVDRGQA